MNRFVRFLFFCFSFFLIFSQTAKAESVSGVYIDPALDVSYFSHYNVYADITGSPTSVSLSIPGVNGDGGNNWNYYASGTPVSDLPVKAMNYDATSSKWKSDNIYPDSIYPEIFYAPSSATWYNTPSDLIIRDNNYQLLHLNNPLTMRASSSFLIEVNAVPRSLTQSVDLQVYLVKKNKTVSFFNSDWMSSPDVELVGTINRNAVKHHSHSVNSSHYLMPLTTNSDGTVGSKNLDINGDFWIILYANASSNSRGWNLKYQTSAICNNTNLWYRGNRTGWTTTAQSGCADSHVHLARRGLNSDGVRAMITANYAGGITATSSDYIYFDPLPNLPPIANSFTNPVSGGVYNGGIGVEKINITWNPATDPNLGDNLNYSIYLMDSVGATSSALILATSSTSYLWDISGVPNGQYSLKGIVCDNNASPLCTDFSLSGNFTIAKVDPVYSLSSISIYSDNATSTIARAGNTITLLFTSTGTLSATTSVVFLSGGEPVSNSANISSVGNNWTATYLSSANDQVGNVSFIISARNLDLEYSNTTDSSGVTVFEYTLSYLAGSHGSLTGTTTQSVDHGGNGTEVVAVPDTGYHFTSWSDGVLTAARTDLNVTASATTTASFVVDAALPVMSGTVSITGSAKFGQLLTANIAGLTYTPAAPLDVPVYQWKRSGAIITGATSSTYTLVESDIATTITVVVTADGVHATGTVTSSATASISKADGPVAPGAPVLSSKTYNRITLIANTLYQFSKDSGLNWQDSEVFSGLMSSTNYNFVARVKATATTNESAAGPAVTVRTDSSSGGGIVGGSANYCTAVTYNNWSSVCFGAFQSRTIATKTPSGCALSATQQLDLQRVCQIVIPVLNEAETKTATTTIITNSGSILQSILTEAQIVNTKNRETILVPLNSMADTALEQKSLIKYKTILGLDKNINTLEKMTVNYFIVYGTKTTKRLGAGERAAVINSYFQAYNKLPNNESEWSDLIKIANGRWPEERSVKAVAQAKLEFVKVYNRSADLRNNFDENAISVISYGLLPLNRNLNSERVAIKSFEWVYGHSPVNALAWNIVRAIAYSGAKR